MSWSGASLNLKMTFHAGWPCATLITIIFFNTLSILISYRQCPVRACVSLLSSCLGLPLVSLRSIYLHLRVSLSSLFSRLFVAANDIFRCQILPPFNEPFQYSFFSFRQIIIVTFLFFSFAHFFFFSPLFSFVLSPSSVSLFFCCLTRSVKLQMRY